MSKGLQVQKYCIYTGKPFKRAHDHRRTCGPCAKDYKLGNFKWSTEPPTDRAGVAAADSFTEDSPAAADAGAAPLRQPLIEIDSPVGEDDDLPRYKPDKYPVTAAVVDAAKPAPDMIDDTTLGMLFETPILLLTEDAVAADGSKPRLTADGKKAMVNVWKPFINRCLLKAADKHADLVLAVFATMLIYGPVAARSVQYRRMKSAPAKKRYKSDTQRGFEEAGIGVEPSAQDSEENYDIEQVRKDIDKRLKR